MSDKLDPLIRVRRHVVEQKQKFLAELYRQAEELETQKATMLRQHQEEQEKIKTMDVDMLSYFGPYSEAVKERVAEIDGAIGTLEARIDIAREDMRESFSELKKIEITQENRQKEIADELRKKEDQVLDEVALDNYRRKQSEIE